MKQGRSRYFTDDNILDPIVTDKRSTHGTSPRAQSLLNCFSNSKILIPSFASNVPRFVQLWPIKSASVMNSHEAPLIIEHRAPRASGFRRRAVVHQAMVPIEGASCPEVRTTIRRLGMADHVKALLAIANRKLSSKSGSHQRAGLGHQP
jgi:hypothetical protein